MWGTYISDKNYKMKILVISLFVLMFKTSKSQDIDTNIDTSGLVKCYGSVIEIDSNYLLIPFLKVLDQKKKIKINRINVFSAYRGGEVSNGNLFLQKKVMSAIVNITPTYFISPMWGEDTNEMIEYGYGDYINDTINLGQKYPMDLGKYFISFVLEYFYEGRQYWAYSEWIEFDVKLPPPHDAFFKNENDN